MCFLLSNKADPHSGNNRMETPLILAARNGHAKVVSKLLERGVNKDAQDDMGETALHAAASYVNVDVINILLKAGASSKIKDINGNFILINLINY